MADLAWLLPGLTVLIGLLLSGRRLVTLAAETCRQASADSRRSEELPGVAS
jgi:hypothetical protein